MPRPKLILVYEPEDACRSRLLGDGFAERHALEISSYLAQSTDLAPEFGEIEAACAPRGIDFQPVELDSAGPAIAAAAGSSALVWTLTDGIAYFRGSAAPTLARLHGVPTFGSDDTLFALCQDKLRSGAVMRALGLPVPEAGLARNGEWIVPPPQSSSGWFVKPNRLGAKIGIWDDSHVRTLEHALDLSRRVHAAYRDDVVVQPYVAGRNVRASYLAVDPAETTPASFFVDSGGDFQTMTDSMALYGETGETAKTSGAYAEPELLPVAASQPEAARRIGDIARQAMSGLGLRDVWSMDFRVEADDTVHMIEFEVCPGLPCFDFRHYCRNRWGMTLAEAMAEAALSRPGKG